MATAAERRFAELARISAPGDRGTPLKGTFMRRETIAHDRALLSRSIDERERATLPKLLVEEEAKPQGDDVPANTWSGSRFPVAAASEPRGNCAISDLDQGFCARGAVSVRFGIDQARGCLQADHVIDARRLAELRRLLKRDEGTCARTGPGSQATEFHPCRAATRPG